MKTFLSARVDRLVLAFLAADTDPEILRSLALVTSVPSGIDRAIPAISFR